MKTSEIKNIPEGYNQVMPYLIVENAAAFLNFVKVVFGATEKLREMRDERVIKHAEIAIGDSVIMLADATEQFASQGGLSLFMLPIATKLIKRRWS